MNEIFIPVLGIPAAQGSKKHVGRGILVESSKKVAPWRQDVRHAALEYYQGEPVSGAVKVTIEFIFSRPKGHYGTGKNVGKLKPSAPMYATSNNLGDLDKLLRSTFDGLAVRSGGTVLKDDSLIVEVDAKKRYAMAESEHVGANIKITKLP